MSFALPTARKRKNLEGHQILSLRVFQSPGGGVPFGEVKYAPGPERAKSGHLWLMESAGDHGYEFRPGDRGGADLDEDTEQSLKTAIRYLLVGLARRAVPVEVPIVGSGRLGRYLCPYCLRLEPGRPSRFRHGDILEGLTCRGPLGPLPVPHLRVTLESWLVESYEQGGVCSMMMPGRRLQQYHVPREFHPLGRGGGQ